ncbi:MAG TPA: phosphate ABC transporter substrate-binding protein [Firmicutes bacterium]|nr:phosphate ABC transporter substrate-binding protein [Bacillota bacterium]
MSSRRRNVRILTAAAAILALTLALGTVGISAATQQLTLTGSTTVLPIAQRAAEVFMEKNKGANISVRGGGSGNGIAALIDGTTDIADSSRFIKQSEVEKAVAKGVYPVPHKVALDGIAIVVHPSNSIRRLTINQIKDIYTGKINNWKELGGPNRKIVAVSRDTSSGTYEVFEELVVKGERVRADALMQASNGAVASTVASTPGAIGYVGLGYVSEKLKALEVSRDGHEWVRPSNQTVIDGDYPIARTLFMFTNGWPSGLAAKFINFIQSPAGQKLVEEVGFVPLY